MCNCRLFIVFLCFLSFFTTAHAQGSAYRDFWMPTYHVERLNYCMLGNKACGIGVANRYCHLMGYQKAKRALIEYNIGFTHYLASNSACKGWGCHGFKLIECVNKIHYKPVAPYYYRLKKFVFPRYNHNRVDWCLEKNKNCGAPAAFSFCRRLGYRKASAYKIEKALPSTKTLGSQSLCFGANCDGFEEIICYR